MLEHLFQQTDESTLALAKKNLARIKVIAASVGYILLVFFVIYGLGDGVYNGFPRVIPFFIILIFLVMSFIRMYQGITGHIPEKKEKNQQKNANEEDSEEIDDFEDASETED